MTSPGPADRWRAVLVLLPLLILTGALGAAAPAAATTPTVDQSRGLPGFCPTATGVTVVVDFQQLGGETLVRCNPSANPGTGLDALKGAGIQVTGVQRWGEAFICRLEDRPSALETVPMSRDPGYHEACINTPPAQAYWSYWTAGNDCGWQYSQWGVKNRDVVLGGFEGWSFSLDAGADANPRPRIAAVRPGTEGGACTPSGAQGPGTNDPQEQQPGAGAGAGQTPVTGPSPAQNPGADPGRSSSAPSGAPEGQQPGSNGATGGGAPTAPTGATSEAPLPAPLPRARSTAPVAEDPDKNVAFTGGESARDVTAAARAGSGASSAAPWAAGAAMVTLAGLALWTARRRRRTREGS